jgi:hypothetical protein
MEHFLRQMQLKQLVSNFGMIHGHSILAPLGPWGMSSGGYSGLPANHNDWQASSLFSSPGDLYPNTNHHAPTVSDNIRTLTPSVTQLC